MLTILRRQLLDSQHRHKGNHDHIALEGVAGRDVRLPFRAESERCRPEHRAVADRWAYADAVGFETTELGAGAAIVADLLDEVAGGADFPFAGVLADRPIKMEEDAGLVVGRVVFGQEDERG